MHTVPQYLSNCHINDFIDCEAISISRFAYLMQIPFSYILLFLYFINFVFLMIWKMKESKEIFSNLIFMASFTLLICIIQYICTFIQTAIICPLYTVINFGNFFFLYYSIKQSKNLFTNFFEIVGTFFIFHKNIWSFLQIISLVTLLVLVGPMGRIPKYWVTSSWRTGVLHESGLYERHYPWIGTSAKNSIFIHEYFDFECPACINSHKNLRQYLFHIDKNIQIIRHNISRVECNRLDTANLQHSCIFQKGSYCAQKQNKFWEFNDYVIQILNLDRRKKPIDIIEDAAKYFDWNFLSFKNCLNDPKTLVHVQNMYQQMKSKNIFATPTYIIDKKMFNTKELFKYLRNL